MTPSLLAAKLILAPSLIALVTLAGRRWGPSAAGWLAGLPITGGPILAFLAIEQGLPFGQRAAVAALAGLLAFVAFCLAYAWSARRLPWYAALPIGYAAYILVGLPLTRWHPGAGVAACCGGACLLLGAWAMPRTRVVAHVVVAHPRWELPARMAAAAVVVIVVTGLAAWLGPGWSGVLTVFPTAATALGVFTHHAAGPDALAQLLRGLCLGMLGVTACFAVLGAGLERRGLGLGFTLGLLAAVAAQGATWLALRWFARREAGFGFRVSGFGMRQHGRRRKEDPGANPK